MATNDCTRRRWLAEVGAALSGGCLGSTRGSPTAPDTPSPVPSPRCTPKYTPIPSTPARPGDLTNGSVRSYVEEIERTKLWNSLYNAKSGRIDVTVEARVDVRTGGEFFVVILRARGSSGGELYGCDEPPEADAAGLHDLYYVSDSRTVAFDAARKEMAATVGTATAGTTPAEADEFTFDVYNADSSAHEVTMTVDSPDGGELYSGRTVPPASAVSRRVGYYPGEYSIEATLANGRRTEYDLQLDTDINHEGRTLALYVTADGEPILSRWPGAD